MAMLYRLLLLLPRLNLSLVKLTADSRFLMESLEHGILMAADIVTSRTAIF